MCITGTFSGNGVVTLDAYRSVGCAQRTTTSTRRSLETRSTYTVTAESRASATRELKRFRWRGSCCGGSGGVDGGERAHRSFITRIQHIYIYIHTQVSMCEYVCMSVYEDGLHTTMSPGILEPHTNNVFMCAPPKRFPPPLLLLDLHLQPRVSPLFSSPTQRTPPLMNLTDEVADPLSAETTYFTLDHHSVCAWHNSSDIHRHAHRAPASSINPETVGRDNSKNNNGDNYHNSISSCMWVCVE